MYIFDFLKSEYNFSGTTLALLSVVILVLFLGLFVSLIVTLTHLKKATTPKFGFAGKPIYPILAILFISISIPLTIISLNNEINFEQQASENIELKFDYDVVERTDSTVTTEFAIIPLIDGEEWGDKTYSVFWFIEGPENVEEFEFNRTRDSLSKIVVDLEKGTYEVKVLVTFEDKSEELLQQVVIE